MDDDRAQWPRRHPRLLSPCSGFAAPATRGPGDDRFQKMQQRATRRADAAAVLRGEEFVAATPSALGDRGFLGARCAPDH